MSARAELEYQALQAARAVVGEYRRKDYRADVMAEWVGKLGESLAALAALPQGERFSVGELARRVGALEAVEGIVAKRLGVLEGLIVQMGPRLAALETVDREAVRAAALEVVAREVAREAPRPVQWFRMTWPEALGMIVDDRKLSARRACWSDKGAGEGITCARLRNWFLSDEAKAGCDWIVELAVDP